MKKLNKGTLSGYRNAVIEFDKSEWTLEAAIEYLNKYQPQYSSKWKRVIHWANGRTHWRFESTEEFSYEADLKFGAK